MMKHKIGTLSRRVEVVEKDGRIRGSNKRGTKLSKSKRKLEGKDEVGPSNKWQRALERL